MCYFGRHLQPIMFLTIKVSPLVLTFENLPILVRPCSIHLIAYNQWPAMLRSFFTPPRVYFSLFLIFEWNQLQFES